MRYHIAGKTVVITGASSGIGRATAQAFARAGANVVLAARGTEALQAVAQICRSLGSPQAIAVTTDATDPAAVRELVSTAMALTGTIDIWVSNVGVGAVGRFEQTPMAAHARVIEANLIGHMNDAHAVLPVFLAQKHGIFVNVISLGAFAGTPFAAAYCASKYGLRGFSESLRAELASVPDVHICDVYPAFIDTPGISHGANYIGRKLTAPPPVYDAREVARAIVGLASEPKPSTVVGQFAQVVRFAHFLAPQLVNSLAAAAMKLYFRRAQRIAVSDGNLFAPPVSAGGIDGGLRRTGPAGIGGMLIAGIVIFGIAALIMASRSDRRPPSRGRGAYDCVET